MNTLARVMELQTKDDLTGEEREELARLELEWSNRWLAPEHYPVRKPCGEPERH